MENAPACSRGFPRALYHGLTEAFNDAEEEIGEHYLVESLRRHHELPRPGLLTAIVLEVRQFSSHAQYDDITLIVAKCREG
jgi:serine phosphatase RsbU (regulator of sigma subunit)